MVASGTHAEPIAIEPSPGFQEDLVHVHDLPRLLVCAAWRLSSVLASSPKPSKTTLAATTRMRASLSSTAHARLDEHDASTHRRDQPAPVASIGGDYSEGPAPVADHKSAAAALQAQINAAQAQFIAAGSCGELHLAVPTDAATRPSPSAATRLPAAFGSRCSCSVAGALRERAVPIPPMRFRRSSSPTCSRGIQARLDRLLWVARCGLFHQPALRHSRADGRSLQPSVQRHPRERPLDLPLLRRPASTSAATCKVITATSTRYPICIDSCESKSASNDATMYAQGERQRSQCEPPSPWMKHSCRC